jgi:hypothetical protein
MAAQKVNAVTKKRLTLKRLAKRKKHIGTGDGGAFSSKMLISK